MNTYDAMLDVRDFLGESVASHWSDRLIQRTLGRIHARYFMKMSMTMGDWFVKRSDALTPSSQAISLPADCGRPLYLEEVTSSREIPMDLSVRDKARTELSESLLLAYAPPRAYVLRDTIVVNQANYSLPLYLWYDQKCPTLHAGTGASGSGANALVLQDSLGHSVVDDYYNGVYVEILSGTGAGTRAVVTDYVGSTRTLTLSGTFGTDSVYGIVPLLPEEGYDAWIARTSYSLLTKAAGVISQEFLNAVENDTREAEEMFFDWIQLRVKNSAWIRQTEVD